MSLTGVANVSGNSHRSPLANSVLNHHDSRELHIDKATLERCLKDRQERIRRWRSQITATLATLCPDVREGMSKCAAIPGAWQRPLDDTSAYTGNEKPLYKCVLAHLPLSTLI